MPRPDEIRAALGKLLGSAEFARSERMTRFLRFVVEEALAGRGEKLKEYSIGVAVFDRPASYDPTVDPIVRVEARRLRGKLERYYLGEGRADAVGIDFPKGRYVPAFCARNVPACRAPGRSIVVSPFTSLNTGAETAYFCAGLTAEVVNELTKISGLRVVAWRGEFDRGSAPAALLRGSVRRSRGVVRIAAQLIDRADGSYLWVTTYQRSLGNEFGVQSDVSRAIARALSRRLRKPDGGTSPYSAFRASRARFIGAGSGSPGPLT